MSDEGKIFWVGAFLASVFWIAMFRLIVIPGVNDDSHRELGSYTHACFANNTCREGLRCLHAVGHEPGTCVK